MAAQESVIESRFGLDYPAINGTTLLYFLASVLSLAAKSTSFCSVSYGTAGTLRPLMNSVGVLLTSRSLPKAIDFSTRDVVSGLAAQAAISAPFTPAASANAVSFSSALAAVMSVCAAVNA